MSDTYCPLCGNTGLKPDGSVCNCRWNSDTFFSTSSCLSIPTQYQGVMFNSILVPQDTGEKYSHYLETLYGDITTLRLQYHNILLCSPHQHSKTIMAYSCIERLFRASLPVFPVCDIMELRNIMNALDIGKEPLYKVDEPENIVEAAYLFVKIPMYPTWECFDTINTLLSRRVRRGKCTIFLYSGTWGQLIYGDKSNLLQQLRGDGSYNTIEVKNFEVEVKDDGG